MKEHTIMLNNIDSSSRCSWHRIGINHHHCTSSLFFNVSDIININTIKLLSLRNESKKYIFNLSSTKNIYIKKVLKLSQERSFSCRGLVVWACDGGRARQQRSPGAPLRGSAGLSWLRAVTSQYYTWRFVSTSLFMSY